MPAAPGVGATRINCQTGVRGQIRVRRQTGVQSRTPVRSRIQGQIGLPGGPHRAYSLFGNPVTRGETCGLQAVRTNSEGDHQPASALPAGRGRLQCVHRVLPVRVQDVLYRRQPGVSGGEGASRERAFRALST